MNIGDDAVPSFVNTGAFLPLDECLASLDFDTSVYLPGLLDPGTVDGQLYFLPKDYSTLADIYLSESIYPLAGQAYISSLTAKNAPVTPEVPLRSAEMLAQRAAYPQAQQLLDAIEKHFTSMPQGDHLKALKIRSRIATALEATDQAVTILKEVIKTDPLDGEALLLLANHYQSEGSPEDLVQSVFYLERAIKVPSVEAEAGVRLAQALVVKSSTDLDKAKKIESLQRAVDLLKRSQDLKKRESVGKYLADLEKALQKTKGL
jgi:tetratricopeptide (TPR) repeat protein